MYNSRAVWFCSWICLYMPLVFAALFLDVSRLGLLCLFEELFSHAVQLLIPKSIFF